MKKRELTPPKNHGETLPFHVLFKDLFNPLQDNKKKPTAGQTRGRKTGPHGSTNLSPHEARRAIIERFFSRWRKEVGPDIYPAMRLILPEKDRDRAMYGLKEKILARCLVKIMRVDKNSEDAYDLINWKIPGQSIAKALAGDFAGRAFETISKRAFRIEVGNMTIDEVNTELNKLAAKSKEEDQLSILEGFYKRMNPEEMMWLIRVILRNMRVGATERTFLDVWHPDAETLFNVCSSLKRVCWDLHDPHVRLENNECSVSLMQCFQPQLAYFNERKQKSYPAMLASMKMTEEDQEFWIEEKLDGERMQLHMNSDLEVAGGRRFRFWSRKAKDYTYLYGDSLYDQKSALTQHIKDAFADEVENIILDGEMITWDPKVDAMVPFGSLKTAALAESRNPFADGFRPLFRVFDILFLNGTDITRYTLRDRRRALEASLKSVYRRIEILEYSVASTAQEIEAKLAKVIEEASEGLVIKNPRSPYQLNDRRDDWVKVKPEYMQEFGENLDCLIIGGYYGSGHRGGNLSSFLCGLRDSRKSQVFQASQNASQIPGGHSRKFLSFFKVGGGMTRDDYASIRHHTEGKWIDWDPKHPPTHYIELAGGPRQFERPDQWIKPEDSLVVEVKAASVNPSDEYAAKLTLRFPRFKKFRHDKDWESALTLSGFLNLKVEVENEYEANKQKRQADIAVSRKRGPTNRAKKPLTIAGYSTRDTNRTVQTILPKSNVFANMNIFIMSDSTTPSKYSKPQLEALAKANGARIVQSTEIKSESGTFNSSQPNPSEYLPVHCIASKRTVKVASLMKRNTHEILNPTWLQDCIEQSNRDFARGFESFVLNPEPARHFFHCPEDKIHIYTDNVGESGDSFARDYSIDDLRCLLEEMNPVTSEHDESLRDQLFDPGNTRGTLFLNTIMFLDQSKSPDPKSERETPHSNPAMQAAIRTATFAGAEITPTLSRTTTHIVVSGSSNVKSLRKTISNWNVIPRIVTVKWIEESWNEGTRLDEDRYRA